jgi:hypothetical protein
VQTGKARHPKNNGGSPAVSSDAALAASFCPLLDKYFATIPKHFSREVKMEYLFRSTQPLSVHFGLFKMFLKACREILVVRRLCHFWQCFYKLPLRAVEIFSLLDVEWNCGLPSCQATDNGQQLRWFYGLRQMILKT